jgi:hypothetical protein
MAFKPRFDNKYQPYEKINKYQSYEKIINYCPIAYHY